MINFKYLQYIIDTFDNIHLSIQVNIHESFCLHQSDICHYCVWIAHHSLTICITVDNTCVC